MSRVHSKLQVVMYYYIIIHTCTCTSLCQYVHICYTKYINNNCSEHITYDLVPISNVNACMCTVSDRSLG